MSGTIRYAPGDLVSGRCRYAHLEQMHGGAWSLNLLDANGLTHLFDLQADCAIRLVAVDTCAEGEAT